MYDGLSKGFTNMGKCEDDRYTFSRTQQGIEEVINHNNQKIFGW